MTRRKKTEWNFPQVKAKMKFIDALFQIDDYNAPIIVSPVDSKHIEYTINESGEFTFTIKGKIKTQLNFREWYKENLLTL